MRAYGSFKPTSDRSTLPDKARVNPIRSLDFLGPQAKTRLRRPKKNRNKRLRRCVYKRFPASAKEKGKLKIHERFLPGQITGFLCEGCRMDIPRRHASVLLHADVCAGKDQCPSQRVGG